MLKPLLSVVLLLAATRLCAQDVAPAPATVYPPYKASLGILANPRLLGLQAEARVLRHFGLRVAATRVFDPQQRQREFSAGGLGLLTYYLPLRNPRIEPVLGLGGVYSLYHWDLGSASHALNTAGNLHDFNVGGGAGVNLRFSSSFRVGLSVLAANGFWADYVDGSMRAVRRRLLVLPALSVDVLL